METVCQKQAILDHVCTTKSFVQHLKHPKLQNWFAWNACAHEQQDEFFATKLIFESQLVNTHADVNHGTFSIKPSTDVRAELQRILKSGGGIDLAYRLMKDGLQQYTKVMYHAEQASPLGVKHIILSKHTLL